MAGFVDKAAKDANKLLISASVGGSSAIAELVEPVTDEGIKDWQLDGAIEQWATCSSEDFIDNDCIEGKEKEVVDDELHGEGKGEGNGEGEGEDCGEEEQDEWMLRLFFFPMKLISLTGA